MLQGHCPAVRSKDKVHCRRLCVGPQRCWVSCCSVGGDPVAGQGFCLLCVRARALCALCACSVCSVRVLCVLCARALWALCACSVCYECVLCVLCVWVDCVSISTERRPCFLASTTFVVGRGCVFGVLKYHGEQTMHFSKYLNFCTVRGCVFRGGRLLAIQ